MARRRQQRRRAKVLRHATKPGGSPDVVDTEIGASVERLTYTRKEAAEALGISLATLDRRVVPAIATVKTADAPATNAWAQYRTLTRRRPRSRPSSENPAAASPNGANR